MSEPAKIHLHTAPPAWGLPSISPACAKLEAWLRMAGVDYDKPTLEFARAPKGKIPFIFEGDACIGDSALIITHLQRTRGIDLDAALSPRERGISVAFRRMLKENDYWGLIHSRYFVAANWAQYRVALGGALAPDGSEDERNAIAEGMKQIQKDVMHGHGIGRHTDEELVELICEDLSAVSALLGDNEWMFGKDGPTTLDATVYGYVGNMIMHPFEDAISDHGRAQANLVALCERVQAKYFPELVGA